MNTRGKNYTSFLIALSLLLLVEPLRAHAYIDPGSGGFLIQMLIASVVGLSVGIRTFWGRIRLLFLGKKNSSAALNEPKDSPENT